MRLELEPNVTAFPLVENTHFENTGASASWDFESILKKGISAAQSGDRDHARKLLSQATAIDPSSEDAWMWLASISEYPEELLAFLNRVLEINPKNERAVEWLKATNSLLAKSLVQRAISANEDGNVQLANQCLDQALVQDKNCEMAWFWKAKVSHSDDHKLDFLNRTLSLNPTNTDALAALAEIKQTRTKAVFEEAKAAAADGDRKKAGEILDNFVNEVPDSVEAWLLKSHLSLGLGEKVEALEKALLLDPDNAAAKSGLAFLALTFGTKQEEVATPAYQTLEVDEEYETAGFVPQPESLVEISSETAESHAVQESISEPEAAQSEQEFSSYPKAVAEHEPAANYDFETEATLVRSVEELFVPDVQNVNAVGVSNDAIANAGQLILNESTIGVVYEKPADISNNIHALDEVPVEFVESLLEEPSGQHDTESSDFDEQTTGPYTGFTCPFCTTPNDPQAFQCTSCHATLTLSDIESLLSTSRAEQEVVQHAVTGMEAEWNLREFSEQELTALGIGHFNLKNFEDGLNYLQEASRLNPNNVILAGQVNTIAIRLGEMRRQSESYNAMPKGKKILVVDDSPTVRKLISGKLEKSGHTVICAVDGIEALARVEEGLPDLVLLDITMPRMDGYEVCKQIRSNPDAKDLPVVMISGKDGFFDKVRGRMAGSSGYVTKPFGPETLMKALETYLLPDNADVS